MTPLDSQHPVKEVTPLDQLYGKGTSAEFAVRVSLASIFPKSTTTIIEHTMQDKGVSTNTVWRTEKGAKIGEYELHFWTGRNHCPHLQMEPAFREKGSLLRLLINMEPWWTTSLGIVKHTMEVRPGSPGEDALMGVGMHRLPSGEFGVDNATRPLIRSFIQWALAGAKATEEPTWRAELDLQPTAAEPF